MIAAGDSQRGLSNISSVDFGRSRWLSPAALKSHVLAWASVHRERRLTHVRFIACAQQPPFDHSVDRNRARAEGNHNQTRDEKGKRGVIDEIRRVLREQM